MYWNATPFRSQTVLYSLLVVVILVAAFVSSVVAPKTDGTDWSKVSKIDPPAQVPPEDSKSIPSDNSQSSAKHSVDPLTISDPINDGILGGKKKKKGIFKKTWKGLKNNAGRISIGAGIVGLSYWLYNKYYPSGGGVTPKVQIGLQQMMPGLSGGAFGGQAGRPVEKPKSQSSNATVWWIVAGVVVIALLVGGFIASNISGDNQEQMQDRDDEMERGQRRRHHRRADRGGHRKRHKKQRRDHR